MNDVAAYPLAWPPMRPRAKHRRSAAFSTSMTGARDSLMRELRLMKARNIVLSSNLALRQDGLPRAGQGQPDDPGVAVYFEWNGDSFAFACDKWHKVEDNLQAIRKTVEAIRGISRWGTGDMVRAAFTGFRALPEAGAGSGTAWWSVLGVSHDASLEDVKRAFREKAHEHHPDKGGSREEWDAIQAAYRQATAPRA